MSAKENLDWKETCAKCMDGEIEPRQCEYYGEPNGCNSPTYGEHPNVGNAAKMRETIEWLKERLTAAVYDGSFEVHEALDKIDAALSAPARNCGEAQSVDVPIGAQTTHDRYSVVTPYLITEQANNAPRGIDKPLRAQTTIRKDYLCTPLVMGQQSCASATPIDKPCPTVATAGAVRMITPIILDMSRPGGHDSGHIRPAYKPMQALTTCDNVQGVFPVLEDGRVIDIRIRMLKPSELAAAHSFPPDYVLTGNRGEQVKQIGNSVPVMTAAAMCEADFAA